MKQVTMRIEGFVTVTVPDGNDTPESIPVKLDVFDMNEHDESYVYEVCGTEITTKEIQSSVDI